MKHSIIVALDEHNQEKFDDVLSQLDPAYVWLKLEVFPLTPWEGSVY
jgi:hypothetical protein